MVVINDGQPSAVAPIVTSQPAGEGAQGQAPAGGEAPKPNWWESVTPEEIATFLDTDAGQQIVKPKFDSRLQSELEKGRQALKTGKGKNVNNKVAEVIREAQEQAARAAEAHYQSQLSAQQQTAFQQQWQGMDDDQRRDWSAQFIDTTLRDQQQRQWMEQQLSPMARQHAAPLAAKLVQSALRERFDDSDWNEAIQTAANVVQEDGVDPNSEDGIERITSLLYTSAIEIERKQMETDYDKREKALLTELDKKFDAFKAELVGQRVRTEGSPDRGGSVGGDGEHAASRAVLDNPHASVADKKRAYEELHGFPLPT